MKTFNLIYPDQSDIAYLKRGLTVLGDVLKQLEDEKKVVVFEIG